MNLVGLNSRLRPRRQRTRTSSPDATAGRASSDDWDTLDLSSTEYARRRRELMQLINDLRSMGAETLIDLPSIVVIGGQSAGKSSLVEAVSGVSVPRDSGTCTRCPMEVTMSSSATTWSCTIKLRFDYDSSGRSVNVQQKEVAFGSIITNRDEVDVWLRRAQAAVLNPELPPEGFYRKTIQELRSATSTNTLRFSRNAVSVFINDPSVTDLSFIDLPGLIQNEDQDVVDLVRELTESYIRRPNTIILTTIPMSDDMQNQLSVRLAREADPEGERTIGILTKPDMLGEGAVNARNLWLDIIEGRQHRLTHGYYCVRLPDDAQRAQHLSRSALQRIAEDYFNTTTPWSGVADRGRFGIPAFVSDVSSLLVSHIQRVIPQLKQDVERLLAACMEEIGTLPEPLEFDPQVEVLGRVNSFCDTFKGMVSGTGSDKSLVQRNKALYTIFTQEILETAPDFCPSEQPVAQEYFESTMAPKLPAIIVPSTRPVTRGCSESPPDSPESEEHAILEDNRVQTMGVHDVRKIILESTAWELPGSIPYEAKTRLINQFTTLWPVPAESCLTAINDVLDNVIQQLVKIHFGRFRVLQDLISDLIRPDIEEQKGRALVAIKETLALEATPIHTQNVTDYQDLRAKWLSEYRKARAMHGYHIHDELDAGIYATERNTSPEREALRNLAQAGYRGLTVHDLHRLCPPDDFEDELAVMADVRAYFTIAYKRIIDHVPLKIHQVLHQGLAERLSLGLFQRLVVDTNSTGNFADRMRELVSEDPAVEARRALLEAKRTRLQEMRRRLVNFVA